jgi:dGTPase
VLQQEELPQEEIAILGDTGSRRIDTLVHDLVETSAETGDIAQSDEIGEAMLALRTFMFERVYHQQDHTHIAATVQRIFADLVERRGLSLDDATDYLAGMTDRFALAYEA